MSIAEYIILLTVVSSVSCALGIVFGILLSAKEHKYTICPRCREQAIKP